MQSTLLEQGSSLMLFGMGTVFVFLTILVFGVRIMSWIVTNFLKEPEVDLVSSSAPRANAPVNKSAASAQGGVDPHVLAVITDAVQQHRARINS